MKEPQDTNAGKSISAFVILKKGKHIANVHAHYSDGGTVTVRAHTFGEEPQMAKAGGYGYDKFVAALSGMTIDGHVMSNHCGQQKKMPKGGFKRDKKAPKGWHYANWSSELDAYTSCYRKPGLEFLEAVGYRVIQAF